MAKQQGADRAVEKVKKYFKVYGLKAVSFDKGSGFCPMTEKYYEAKLSSLLNSRQFCENMVNSKKACIMRIEDQVKEHLRSRKKRKRSLMIFTDTSDLWELLLLDSKDLQKSINAGCLSVLCYLL